MNLKICPICRSLYPSDFSKCERCNEQLIDNEIYKKWNDIQKSNYQKKYKSKYQTSEQTIIINKPTQPSQPTPQNIPKCPTCGSTNVEKISTAKKAFGFALVGLFSSNLGKTMHCRNCGYKW